MKIYVKIIYIVLRFLFFNHDFIKYITHVAASKHSNWWRHKLGHTCNEKLWKSFTNGFKYELLIIIDSSLLFGPPCMM